MENWLLIVVGIIFLLSFIWGLSQGLLRIVVSLLATVITIALVTFMVPIACDFVEEKTSLGAMVGSAVTSAITPAEEKLINDENGGSQNGADDSEGAEEESKGKELSQQEQVNAVEESTFPSLLKSNLLENNNSEIYSRLGVNTFYDYVGAYVGNLIIRIIVFLFVYMVVRIFIRIVMGMIDVISELPVLHGINRLTGGIVGLGIGLVAVWIFFLVITIIYATSFGQECFRQIEGNSILTVLYENDIILHLLSAVK